MERTDILLIQLFSNGDCLYATAVARQVKKDFPGARLTWAISSSCMHIIANNPFVDEVLEVTAVKKDDEQSFRRFLNEIKAQSAWSRVIVTHIMGRNQANYDGCIRSTIFRGYKYPLDVNVQPVLRLYKEEIEKVRLFAERHQLTSYENVILFEFAPLSGQSAITLAQSLAISEKLAGSRCAVILSSANKIVHSDPSIIDGSALSIRETAALTHYCNFLIGCSSGITWLTTSDAAKQLPMVQLLNPFTKWINPISRDFNRFNINADRLIELFEFDNEKVVACVKESLVDFDSSKNKWHQKVPLHFETTQNIVYNLLCYLEFSAILKHIRINREVFGNKFAFYKNLFIGFIIFPFRLISNFFRKKILR